MTGQISVAMPIFAALIALAGAWWTARINKLNNLTQLNISQDLKLVEIRERRISDLTDAMAEFQSRGVTPDVEHATDREFYKWGTKIELLIGKSDPDFEELQSRMYEYLAARTIVEKYAANPRYVEICIRILERKRGELDSMLTEAA